MDNVLKTCIHVKKLIKIFLKTDNIIKLVFMLKKLIKIF